MAAYQVVSLDCNTVRTDRTPVVAANVPVGGVQVLSVPTGARPLLYFGDGPGVPVYAGFSVDMCPTELAGIWWTNATAVPGNCEVFIAIGGIAVGGS